MQKSTPLSSDKSQATSVKDGSDSPLQSPDTNTETDDAEPSLKSEPNDVSANDTLLNEDPFASEHSRILFDSIDQLRGCGAGQDLDIPQLVIVGQQSVGKSSLLQSLTDIPFQVGDGLCTQFATRIISRRTKAGSPERIEVSIEPGDVNPFATQEDDARIRDFQRLFIPSMTAEAFRTLVEEAKEAMGLNLPQTLMDRNYSSKVLKIEISGPTRSQFAILDMPGIFSAKLGEVSKREMQGVSEMVSSYLRKPENIIICVADSSGDVANASILTLAEECKVDSSRMVGVFTKCDLAPNPARVVKILNDQDGLEGQFLRWYVVQNRGPNSPQDFDHEEAEYATFSKEPWTQIPRSQRGTVMLKRYLANRLCQRIRTAFPEMRNTAKRLLEVEKSRRKGLGEPRIHHSQRLKYLTDIVSQFQQFAEWSLASPWALPSDDLKLRGFVSKEKDRFALEMEKNGHTYPFFEIGDNVKINPILQGSSLESPNLLSGSSQIPINNLYELIRDQRNKNRGQELPGMLNPAVLLPLWQKQTTKWHEIGKRHLKELVKLTTDVAHKLLERICLESGVAKRTAQALHEKLTVFEAEAETVAMQKLKELCDRSSTMAPQTSNPLFIATVRNSQMSRFKVALNRYMQANRPTSFLKTGPAGYETWAIIPDNHFAEVVFHEVHPHGSRLENVDDEIHDLLKAYYAISIPSFIDYVGQNIVEPFLHSKQGPLLGLSQEFIMSLTEAEIEELGGEEESAIKNRQASDMRIRRLEETVEIATSAWNKTRDLDL